ncbi:CHAD domain-containing protein [Actinokineospora soli]|uniref:CHAD domain-containing protein n=1 Tax=Actinokineospora soli TaxID=1048753 RepID=A0ABW2TH01_9PSEU
MRGLTDAVRSRLDEQARALVHHAEGARADTDAEHVHQLRVSVRRARAVLKTVRTFEHLQAELQWLGGACGDVRDADVMLARFRAEAADFTEDERDAVERLLDGLVKQRRGARRHMLAALRSARFRGLVAELEEAARTVEPAAGEDAPVGDVVDRPRRKFAKAVDALGDDPPDDDLHRLRIRGKRLRYAAEMVGGKKAKKLVKATKDLQDVLGDHQDATVAEDRLRALVDAMESPDTEVVLVAGRLIERERARKAECRKRWRAVAGEVGDRAGAL